MKLFITTGVIFCCRGFSSQEADYEDPSMLLNDWRSGWVEDDREIRPGATSQETEMKLERNQPYDENFDLNNMLSLSVNLPQIKFIKIERYIVN